MTQKAPVPNLHYLPPVGIPTPSKLRIGMKGNLPIGEVEIIGRICYRARQRSRLYEDLKKSKEQRNDKWCEWLLQTSLGELYWLEEENNTHLYIQQYIPTVPLDPESITDFDNVIFDEDALNVRTTETGIWEIVFYEGKLPRQLSLGKRANYLRGKLKNRRFRVQWNEHEIHFYKGEIIWTHEIYKAFSVKIDKTFLIFQFVFIFVLIIFVLFILLFFG